MLFEKPTKKVPTNNGTTEQYLLEDDSISLTVKTIIGGYEFVDTRNSGKKTTFILRGLGEAIHITDRETKKEEVLAVLNEGDLYEIPTMADLKLQGQLRHLQFVGVESVEKGSITKETKRFPAVDKTTIIYVVDGIANYKTQDSKYIVLREDNLLEVPAGIEFELKGTINYIVAR